MDELAQKIVRARETLMREALPADWLERAAGEFKLRRARRTRSRRMRWALLGAVAAVGIGAAAERWRGMGMHAALSTAPPPAPSAQAGKPVAVHLADGSSATPFDDMTVLRADASSPSRLVVELVQGGARFAVERRPSRVFRVDAGPAVVEVFGSEFTVERIASQVRVAVFKGDLQVVCQGRVVHLFEGETAMFPRAPAWQTSEHDTAPASEPIVTADPPARVTRRVPSTADALLNAADAARRAHRPERAIAPLREMVARHTRDPRTPAAAFTLGRVLMDVGEYRQAADAFVRAAALDGGGSLTEDALAREVEAWSRGGESARARARAAGYLQRYPGGVHVAAMRSHTGADGAR